MSKQVKVAYGDVPADVANQLLAAAEELDLPSDVVGTQTGPNAFVVPEEVAKKAGLDYETDDDEPESEAAEEPEPEKLKGKALETALEERGLKSEGTADEKRAAVAAYDAENS